VQERLLLISSTYTGVLTKRVATVFTAKTATQCLHTALTGQLAKRANPAGHYPVQLAMASFYAELQVVGARYPVQQCVYEFTQATSERGRVQAKVRHRLVQLVLDVPTTDILLAWAATPHKPLAGQVVFYTAKGGAALETLAWESGECVGYQEEFVAGELTTGAYRCHLTIAALKLTMQPGGPAAYVSPAPGDYGTASQALVNPFVVPLLAPVAPVLEELVLPSVEELAAAAAKSLLETALTAAAAAALPVVLTVGLILGSSTPAQAPGIPQPHLPPLSREALRLLELEQARRVRALTSAEEAELIALLASVRGIHVTGTQDLAYYCSQEIAFNKLWDQHAPPALKQLEVQRALDHVEQRDYSVPRSNGIGGAHNAVEFAKHHAEYVELSRVPHPTVPGVAQVEYQIYALDRELKPTGKVKAKVYSKTVYDPAVWPRPRLEQALKQALSDSYRQNANTLPREWTGQTAEGYGLHGFYNAQTKHITTFFFEPPI
jgi:hypothetical protein